MGSMIVDLTPMVGAAKGLLRRSAILCCPLKVTASCGAMGVIKSHERSEKIPDIGSNSCCGAVGGMRYAAER